MVDEGFLTLDQLSLALAEQDSTGRPLGKVLVELGFVSEGAVANALAEQHGGLLKTEFGISAGLHAISADAAPATHAPEPPDRATRIEQLESTLRTVVAERDAFVQKANELQARLSEAAQPGGAEVAHVTAAAAARIAELEADVQARLCEAEQKHAADVAHVTACAAARIDELEADLQARSSEAAQPDDAEVAHVAAAAAARITELEAEVQAALSARNELETAVRLGATRIAELQREVAELREQAEQRQRDEQAAAEAAVEATVERAHLLLTPSPSGYTLMEWPGPAPAPGTLLDVDGAGFVVLRVGVSPFPGSSLRCVFLERS
jgi:hypothetical protein